MPGNTGVAQSVPPCRSPPPHRPVPFADRRVLAGTPDRLIRLIEASSGDRVAGGSRHGGRESRARETCEALPLPPPPLRPAPRRPSLGAHRRAARRSSAAIGLQPRPSSPRPVRERSLRTPARELRRAARAAGRGRRGETLGDAAAGAAGRERLLRRSPRTEPGPATASAATAAPPDAELHLPIAAKRKHAGPGRDMRGPGGHTCSGAAGCRGHVTVRRGPEAAAGSGVGGAVRREAVAGGRAGAAGCWRRRRRSGSPAGGRGNGRRHEEAVQPDEAAGQPDRRQVGGGAGVERPRLAALPWGSGGGSAPLCLVKLRAGTGRRPSAITAVRWGGERARWACPRLSGVRPLRKEKLLSAASAVGGTGGEAAGRAERRWGRARSQINT